MDNVARIAMYSDLHGCLADPVECDLAIIAGDCCPETMQIQQHVWLDKQFRHWLHKFPRAVWVAGNHDYVCNGTGLFVPDFGVEYTYLRDEGCRPFAASVSNPNLLVWGTPWSLPFGQYAFMATEEEIARRLVGAVGADILISHGPPFGLGDGVSPERHVGSVALLDFIRQHRPALLVTGHIHEGRGVYGDSASGTIVVNASCYELYRPIIVTVEVKDGRTSVVDYEE